MKPSKHSPTSKAELSQDPTCRNSLPSLLNALMTSVAILTLSAASARAQTLTNWLANPSFELGTSPWVTVPTWSWKPLNEFCAVQSTNGFVYPSTTVHVTVHRGTNAVKIWGYNQPYTVPDGLMQTFPCAPGSTWAASGWANTQSPDNMTSTETSYIELMFLDATTNYNTPLGDYTSSTMTPVSPVSTWLPFQVTDGSDGTNLTAPAGTGFVRFMLRFSQPSGYPGGSCYWDDVALIRTSKPDPEITTQPAALTKVYGQTATFSVVADGLTPLSYLWQKDWANITDPNAHGVNTATLILSNVTTTTMGNYTVTVTDQAGPLTSDQAYLTVLDPGVISITPPLGQTTTNGGSATFSVVAAGSATLIYQWDTNGTPLFDNGRISGTTSNVLTVANVTAADNGTYNVMIDGGAAQASSGLKVVSAAQLATNLLVNPGFEDGVFSEPWESGWIGFGGRALATTNDVYYGSATPVSVYDGNYVCRTYAGEADNGIYENNLPATVGATYHAGGHFYVSSLDPVTGLAWVVLQVMFKDAGANTISTFASPQIGTNFSADTWTFLQISNTTGGLDLVAPAGTVSATCQVYEYAQQGGGGSVYFDDLYLTLAQAAPPPSFSITPSVAGGQINITFLTANGIIYDVLYTGNPHNALSTWQTNSTVIGNGAVKSVPDTLGAAARFYRVRAHNP
jgi:Immunoglobulin domain